MAAIQPFPNLWLISDERNDAMLDQALQRLPRGSGFIYRHYHLPDAERVARYSALLRIARAQGHIVVLADSAPTALEWRADGIYGAPLSLYPRRNLLTLATVHDMREIGEANRMGADAALLSPAFLTKTHPGAPSMGPVKWRMLAQYAQMPVIALGGMNQRKARRLGCERWAAIDGLSS